MSFASFWKLHAADSFPLPLLSTREPHAAIDVQGVCSALHASGLSLEETVSRRQWSKLCTSVGLIAADFEKAKSFLRKHWSPLERLCLPVPSTPAVAVSSTSSSSSSSSSAAVVAAAAAMLSPALPLPPVPASRKRKAAHLASAVDAPVPVAAVVQVVLPSAAPPAAAVAAMADPQEKRLKPWKSSMPQGMGDRLMRAFTNRLYLISRKPSADPLQQSFNILGHSGNVYTVTVGRLLSCSCPDAGKGHHCKHILFTLIRVLKLPRASPLIYQTALVASELQEILQPAAMAATSDVLAPDLVRREYAKITGDTSVDVDVAAANTTPKVVQKPYQGDECAICFEELQAKELLVWCQASCGKTLHGECMTRLIAHNQKNGMSVTPCPLCREPWVNTAAPPLATSASAASAVAAPVQFSSSYVNMAHVSQEHRDYHYSPQWYIMDCCGGRGGCRGGG
jgi:hypothetical protein